MRILRISLHLALVLSLTALTCNVGAVCAAAETGESCCCKTEDGSLPCSDLLGDRDAPGAPEHPATVDSGARSVVAVLDAGPLAVPPVDVRPSLGVRARFGVMASATPLYLSHCAFLC